MAITSQYLFDTLKTFYAKEGVVNLLYRNSPVLAKLHQELISGEAAEFPAIYARSAGVGSNYITVKNNISRSARVKKFRITPANMFAGESFNAKEIQASNDQKGSFLPIAEVKMYSALESYRKIFAMALYNDGSGYIADLPATDTSGSAITSIASNAEVEIELPIYATMYIDVGSSIKIKADRFESDDTDTTTWEVTAIDDKKVTIKNVSGSTYTVSGTPVITVAGAISTKGDKLLPTGLAAWLPKTVTKGENFFGIDRSVARTRLAGSHIVAKSGEKKYETLQRAIAAVHRYGSKSDMIVMNDEDYIAMGAEIEEKTTFMKTVGGNSKGKANVGYDGFGFSVITNFLDNVIADQYCPKGTAYILDSTAINIWSFNDVKKILEEANVEGGKPSVASADGSLATRPHQLLVDSIFSIEDGVATEDGPASIVSVQTYPQFVITNPAECASVELN